MKGVSFSGTSRELCGGRGEKEKKKKSNNKKAKFCELGNPAPSGTVTPMTYKHMIFNVVLVVKLYLGCELI